MEAKEALGVQPNGNFGGDPTRLLQGHNYLDPQDPIDRLLIDYKEDVTNDSLQTAAEQRSLIVGLRNGDLDSARALIDGHRGLIAAIAYPFKAGELNSEQLLERGVHAFVQAAKTYDTTGGVDFSDYAAAAVHDVFSDATPDMAGGSFIGLPQRPMESVYQFMQTVRPVRGSQSKQRLEEQMAARKRLKLDPLQRTILQRIVYMKDKDVAQQPDIDLSTDSIAKHVSDIMQAASLPHNNRTALLLKLHREGMKFHVATPIKPVDQALYAHEITIAQHLHLPYEEIMEIDEVKEFLGSNCRIERVGEIVYQARQKIGARTRQELALMVEIFYDESEALEQDRSNNRWKLAKHLGLKTLESCDIEALLAVTTKKQRPVIETYHLSEERRTWPETGDMLGMKPATAQALAGRGISLMARELKAQQLAELSSH